MKDQSVHTAGTGCVTERDGLWPARKSIYHCEEVGETVGWWQWSYKVHLDVIESLLRDAELLKWDFDVCLDFGRLAWDALFGPNPYLFLETTPHKPQGDELSCTVH